jgi:hypothetical protein
MSEELLEKERCDEIESIEQLKVSEIVKVDKLIEK